MAQILLYNHKALILNEMLPVRVKEQKSPCLLCRDFAAGENQNRGSLKFAMKAVVKFATGSGNVELRDVPEPRVGPKQVKIEIKAAGICGTDIHIYKGEYDCRPPVILGHEFSGIIVETGKEVSDFCVGEPVTAEPFAVVCGTCLYCRTGNPNLCPKRLSAGSGVDGGMTKYCVMPAERVHRLPKNLGFYEGALIEPLACCVHSVNELTEISPGDVVVIMGPGVIGLLCLQLAKTSGGTTILLGTAGDEERLNLGLTLGADYAVNIESQDVRKLISELTNGLGADVVIECSGSAAAVRAGLNLVRKGGKYTQVGLLGKPVSLDFEQIAFKEIKVMGGFGSRWTSWERAITLLSQGRIQISPLISAILPISQWEEGFSRFERREGVKILLTPED